MILLTVPTSVGLVACIYPASGQEAANGLRGGFVNEFFCSCSNIYSDMFTMTIFEGTKEGSGTFCSVEDMRIYRKKT